MITAPLRPTFARYRKMAFSPLTQLRWMQYEKIPQIRLQGRILDVGGGKGAHYAGLLKPHGTLDSLNVNPKYEPTYVADANRPWPIESALYDTVISFNTLEHVERDVFALGELLRVLKPGGSFHILVPYLYKVHASPHDYHRHTAEGWTSMLREAGIPNESQTIEPMVWDSFSTAFSFLEMTRLRHLKPLALLVGLLRLVGTGKSQHLPDKLVANWSEYAIGYHISGTKPL